MRALTVPDLQELKKKLQEEKASSSMAATSTTPALQPLPLQASTTPSESPTLKVDSQAPGSERKEEISLLPTPVRSSRLPSLQDEDDALLQQVPEMRNG